MDSPNLSLITKHDNETQAKELHKKHEFTWPKSNHETQ